MKSDAYDDLERELTAVYEPVERDPRDVAALRRLCEVLDRHCADEDRPDVTYLRAKLAHDRALTHLEHDFIVTTARLALDEYRNGF